MRWLADKVGRVDASARWQVRYAQILKEHGLVHGINNPSLFVYVERDIRLLAHGDDFMAEVPTHEEKWFESVLFSKHDGTRARKFLSDGNIATESVGSHIWHGWIRWCSATWDWKTPHEL